MRRFGLILGLLTTAVGYAVLMEGGDGRFEVNVALLVLAVAAISGSSDDVDSDEPRSLTSRLIALTAIAFPLYVAFQLVPLPLGILNLLSPTRAELAAALGGIMAAPRVAPLSISPANTWIQLSRITACAMVFLIARQLARRSRGSVWIPVTPLLVIGVLEATLGVAQWTAGATSVTGTYLSKNHFAGFLEMTLPIAVMYGIASLSPSSDHQRRPELVSLPGGIKASLALAAAGAILAATMFSLSKMGIVAALAGLFCMGALYLGTVHAGWRRWTRVAGLAVVVLGVFVFVSPPELIQRFGGLATEDSEGRLPIARDAVGLVAAYPLFGTGLGNFYPAITRYQVSGVNVAWVNAHNDYLQLLSELGIVGWLIPAVLMAAVLTTALRAARSAVSADVRCLAIGCVGAMAAIGLHSFADFNMYVFANAMVLAWVTGVASAVAAPAAGETGQPDRRRAVKRSIDKSVLALGVAAGIYASGSLFFLQRFRSDAAMERVFCRFGICDTDAAKKALARQRSENPGGELTVPQLIEYLPRDPAAADQWDDVGVAMQKDGQTALARYSFSRAVTLAPNLPPILLMAASFHLEVGEHAQAFQLMSRSLSAGAQFDEAAFGDLEVRQIDVEDILNSGMLAQRSSTAYLRELISIGNVPYAERTWRWLLDQKFADDRLACQYVEFLVGAKKSEKAFEDWAVYAGKRSPGYPEPNRLFNGDFDAEPSGCRFDWEVKPAAGVAISFDREVAYLGGRSLRLQFDGSANPSEIGVRQMVFLKPGRYSLSGYLRTKELSTDEGVGLRVADATGASALNVMTEKLVGTNEWTPVHSDFDAPSTGGLVTVSISRTPTLKFDNHLRGSAWIDRMSITNVLEPTPSR